MIEQIVTCGDCEGSCCYATDEIHTDSWDELLGILAQLHGRGLLVRDKLSNDLVWWQDRPHECRTCVKMRGRAK